MFSLFISAFFLFNPPPSPLLFSYLIFFPHPFPLLPRPPLFLFHFLLFVLLFLLIILFFPLIIFLFVPPPPYLFHPTSFTFSLLSSLPSVIGSKVNMAARLMMNYPSIVSCDEETYKAAICKLNKQDFDPLPSKPLKGIADPGIIREYTKEHE